MVWIGNNEQKFVNLSQKFKFNKTRNERDIFIVEEDQESGYTARAVGLSIFTEAETVQELKKNIKEVLEYHFDNPDDMPKIANLQ